MRGVVLFLVIIVLGLSGLTGYQLAEAREAHSALCSLKRDLQVRHDNSQKYLAETDGPVIFGIPREVIEQSASNQAATLESLEGLEC